VTYWPLIGVALVVAGFAAKRNPVLVVVLAGLASGLAAGKSPGDVLELLGTAFVSNRTLLLFTLTLPVIGVLERAGLRERARAWILGFARLTLARLLIVYLAARQLLSMIGLINIAGHPQTVRPLLAPMAEATAARKLGALDDDARERVRALAAATDNVGMFFGEDVFLAYGAVLLIQGFYDGKGIHLSPTDVALWALPTAVAAFVIHACRIAVFQLRLEHRMARTPAVPPRAVLAQPPAVAAAPGAPAREVSTLAETSAERPESVTHAVVLTRPSTTDLPEPRGARLAEPRAAIPAEPPARERPTHDEDG